MLCFFRMITISEKLSKVVEKYEKEHQHPQCIRMHYVGIPLVTLGTMALLGHAPRLSNFDWRYALLVLNFVYFSILDFKMGLLFVSFVGGLGFFISQYLTLPVSWAVFIMGWVFAIGGHVLFEKNKPAFFDNFMQTLLGVGPMALLVQALGAKKKSISR